MSEPTRRVVLLGASNVVVSFATIVQTAQRTWDVPLEIMAAMGHGRSFGQESVVLGRKFSGIFSCALWQDLQARPSLPTAALVTDVGNDLMYGVTPKKLLEWVVACLDRLSDAGAMTIVTELPLATLAGLSERRFRFFRHLLFPRSQLTLTAAKTLAVEVSDGLRELAASRKMPVISVSGDWYGFDPIHLRASVRQRAWPQILAPWRAAGVLPTVRAPRLLERVRLARLAPFEREVFGRVRRASQPSGRLADGTTISLY